MINHELIQKLTNDLGAISEGLAILDDPKREYKFSEDGVQHCVRPNPPDWLPYADNILGLRGAVIELLQSKYRLALENKLLEMRAACSLPETKAANHEDLP